jgi:transcriptional regulator with GAF, ATPase, and Fis domain
VLLEGNRPTAGGMRCSLRDIDEILVGRSGQGREATRSARRLVLTLPDAKVSSQHAVLRRQGSRWSFEDLGSTNGSIVNGRAERSASLSDGDLVRVGSTVLRLRLESPTPSGSPEVAEVDDATDGLATLIPALAAEVRVLEKVARSRIPILLLGETGTGKEVTARAIHERSGRRGAFVAVNCAALPGTLVEAQLFGHVRGAFSGAVRDEKGLFRSADQGTIFLDEIGDLAAVAQGALLRVLQEGEVVPIGATQALRVDVRVISATHRPIDAMAAAGAFRPDLFARLRGFTHALWPLRERRDDLGLLVRSLLLGAGPWDGRIAGDAALALAGYAWPFNVRELSQALARARAVAGDGPLGVESLPPEIAACAGAPSEPSGAFSAEDGALRAALVKHLQDHHGNVAAVARAMQKAPMQVYRWMERLQINPRDYRG